MTPEQLAAVEKIAAILREFQRPASAVNPWDPADISSDRDESVRQIVRRSLERLGVYDAHGCPLCLS